MKKLRKLFSRTVLVPVRDGNFLKFFMAFLKYGYLYPLFVVFCLPSSVSCFLSSASVSASVLVSCVCLCRLETNTSKKKVKRATHTHNQPTKHAHKEGRRKEQQGNHQNNKPTRREEEKPRAHQEQPTERRRREAIKNEAQKERDENYAPTHNPP